MEYELHDLAGNIGVGLVLITYLLLQMEKLSSKSIWYSGINALGAGLVGTSLLYDFNLSAFIIEVSWALISLIGVTRYFRNAARKSF